MEHTPTELAKLFEKLYPPDENGWTPKVAITDLEKINPNFRTKNGCQWARSDSGYLSKYNIERIKVGRKVEFIQLCGYKEVKLHREIPANVRNYWKGKPSAFSGLYIEGQMELDHKDATYTKVPITINDIQPSLKCENDYKRQKCKECKAKNCRFDARVILGNSIPYYAGGSELDKYGCIGCYLYDPVEYRRVTTQNAKPITI